MINRPNSHKKIMEQIFCGYLNTCSEKRNINFSVAKQCSERGNCWIEG